MKEIVATRTMMQSSNSEIMCAYKIRKGEKSCALVIHSQNFGADIIFSIFGQNVMTGMTTIHFGEYGNTTHMHVLQGAIIPDDVIRMLSKKHGGCTIIDEYGRELEDDWQEETKTKAGART